MPKSGHSRMILRARSVVTMDGPPIKNGAVAIVDDRIVDVGTFEEVNARTTGEIIDLGERTLLPGLINAHCHLDYTCLRGQIPPQKSFTAWIRAINAEKAKLSADDYVASIEAGFAEARRFGTTAVANLTAFPELISRVTTQIRTWWFPELIDVRENVDIDLIVQSLEAAQEWGLAPHALFTASAELYWRSGQVATLLTTHLAESREEMEMFRNASGSLYDFLKEIGRDMNDCGGKTPLAEFVGRGGSPNRSRAIEVNRPCLLVHMNELDESDFDLLAKLAPKFSIVHCPRSHRYFRHTTFQFERLRTMGFNISLGTDSLASNDDLSVFAEMRAFQKTFRDVPAERVLPLVTVNGARALRRADKLGRIRAGFLADLIAVPASPGPKMSDEIIAFEGEPWTMIAGKLPKFNER